MAWMVERGWIARRRWKLNLFQTWECALWDSPNSPTYYRGIVQQRWRRNIEEIVANRISPSFLTYSIFIRWVVELSETGKIWSGKILTWLQCGLPTRTNLIFYHRQPWMLSIWYLCQDIHITLYINHEAWCPLLFGDSCWRWEVSGIRFTNKRADH